MAAEDKIIAGNRRPGSVRMLTVLLPAAFVIMALLAAETAARPARIIIDVDTLNIRSAQGSTVPLTIILTISIVGVIIIMGERKKARGI